MTQNISFTEQEIQILQTAISEANSGELVDSGAKDQFCELWPKAKQALNLLLPLLGLVPGIGLFAKAAIGAVIAAGDAAHAALCGS